MINTGILMDVVRSQCTDLGCWMVEIHRFRSQCTDLGRRMVAFLPCGGGGGLLYYYALSKNDGSTSICVLTSLSYQF